MSIERKENKVKKKRKKISAATAISELIIMQK
jgi:hypothetical protein